VVYTVYYGRGKYFGIPWFILSNNHEDFYNAANLALFTFQIHTVAVLTIYFDRFVSFSDEYINRYLSTGVQAS